MRRPRQVQEPTVKQPFSLVACAVRWQRVQAGRRDAGASGWFGQYLNFLLEKIFHLGRYTYSTVVTPSQADVLNVLVDWKSTRWPSLLISATFGRSLSRLEVVENRRWWNKKSPRGLVPGEGSAHARARMKSRGAQSASG